MPLKKDGRKPAPRPKRREGKVEAIDPAVAANPIDLCTVDQVLEWLNTTSDPASDGDAGNIQLCITSFSWYWMRQTAQGLNGGAIPTVSPFVQVCDYDEFYDGQGNTRQFLRQWPIVSVSLVQVNSVVIPQSTQLGVRGWVIDAAKKSIALRNWGSSSSPGSPLTVGFNTIMGAGYRFLDGVQNVRVTYTAGWNDVPFDINECAVKAVAANYKRKSWIDQKSQAMANGAGTISYRDWMLEPWIIACVRDYQRKAIV